MSNTFDAVKIIYIGTEKSLWLNMLETLATTGGDYSLKKYSDWEDVLENLEGFAGNPILLVHEFLLTSMPEIVQKLNFPAICLNNVRKNTSDHKILSLDPDISLCELENHILKLFFRSSASNSQSEDHIHNAQEIVARAVHDLRTPLMAILGYCNLSRYHFSNESASFQRNLTRIEHNAKSMQNLITRYMTRYRAANNELEVTRVSTNIVQLFEDELSFDISRIVQKGLEFRKEICPTVPDHIFLDSFLLTQILRNLLDNALFHTHNGEIIISIQFDKSSEHLNFEIKDSGVGIPEENHQSIFNPFRTFREREEKIVGNNVGLGLSQARDFARLLGGDLKLKASEPGKGSIFHFWVEARLREPAPPRQVGSNCR